MNLDSQLFYLLHNFTGQNEFLDQTIFFVGEYLIWLIGLLFVWSIYRHYKKDRKSTRYLPLLAFTSAIITNVCISFSMKMLIHRLRPFQVLPIHHLITDTTYAFPSGHTTFMFALATGVYAYNKKLSITLYIFGLLIGIARIMGGVHWPSDILGGAVTGFLAAWLLKKLFFKKAQKFLNTRST